MVKCKYAVFKDNACNNDEIQKKNAVFGDSTDNYAEIQKCRL